MMKKAILALLALPLLAQSSDMKLDFKGDPKAIMLACADKARSIKPKDSRLLAEYGRSYLTSGDRVRAEEAFKLGVAVDPKDGETHFLIGYAWIRNGFKAEALEAFKQMETMDPKGKNSFARAAVVLLDAGEDARATELMEKAWRLDPKDWQNTVEFARACVRTNKLDLASIWFDRTISARPKEERMWNEIALAYADKGTPARTTF